LIKSILFVSHSAELNGAERMLLQILKNIDRNRFHPLLILPSSGILKEKAEELDLEVKIVPFKWWLTERVKVWKLPFSWLWNVKSVFRLYRLIKQREISLVFTNSSAVFSGAWAAKIAKVPHVWSIHEILSGQEALLHFWLGKKVLVKLIDWLSAAVIVNSQASQRSFTGSQKVRLIYGGFELPKVGLDSVQNLRQELGLSQKDFVLGVVGKIYRGKGQKEAILTVFYLRQKSPFFKLLMVGEVKDKRYYRELKKMIRQLGLEKAVLFTGYQQDIFGLIKTMDLLLVTSTVDSLGLAALEAMAVATPVLAVKAGGLSEVISDGENGFLVESSQPEVIAKAIESIWRYPSQLNKASQRGTFILKEKFSLTAYIQKIEQVLDEYCE